MCGGMAASHADRSARRCCCGQSRRERLTSTSHTILSTRYYIGFYSIIIALGALISSAKICTYAICLYCLGFLLFCLSILMQFERAKAFCICTQFVLFSVLQHNRKNRIKCARNISKMNDLNGKSVHY